jgi:hypothetical protein
MGRLCSTYGAKNDTYSVLVRKPKGKRPLGKPRHTWEDNIKMMNLREIGWGSKD